MVAFLALVFLALPGVMSALGQTPPSTRTVVKPLPDEEILLPCEYQLAPLEVSGPLRAAWVVFDRGQDYLRWFQDPQIRAFANAHSLALVLAMHCRSKEREDMIVEPGKGVGRALYTALDQFAAAEHRPDLGKAPVIAMGWSGAGSLVGRLAGYRPDRYLAAIAYAPGQYEPLGMDTIELSREAIRSPQLIIANGGDSINGTERPYAYFRKYFEQGAPWTFVVQNRTPHCCLQNAQSLILDWLDAVLSREPAAWGTGLQGYMIVKFSSTVDDWKRPVFNASDARIAAQGVKKKAGEIPAGWLPSAQFAEAWQLFVRRAAPIAVWKP